VAVLVAMVVPRQAGTLQLLPHLHRAPRQGLVQM
jgi:hypothetical protein